MNQLDSRLFRQLMSGATPSFNPTPHMDELSLSFSLPRRSQKGNLWIFEIE